MQISSHWNDICIVRRGLEVNFVTQFCYSYKSKALSETHVAISWRVLRLVNDCSIFITHYVSITDCLYIFNALSHYVYEENVLHTSGSTSVRDKDRKQNSPKVDIIFCTQDEKKIAAIKCYQQGKWWYWPNLSPNACDDVSACSGRGQSKCKHFKYTSLNYDLWNR